jgi:hypothetical protein
LPNLPQATRPNGDKFGRGNAEKPAIFAIGRRIFAIGPARQKR